MLAAQFPAETIDLEVYGRFANHVRDELPRRTRQGIVPRNEEKFDQLDQRPTQALFDIAFLPEAEDAHVAARWRIPGTDGTPIGRLHLSIDPGLRPSQPKSPAPTPDKLQPLELTPIYLVKLTARVSPSKHSVASVTRHLMWDTSGSCVAFRI